MGKMDKEALLREIKEQTQVALAVLNNLKRIAIEIEAGSPGVGVKATALEAQNTIQQGMMGFSRGVMLLRTSLKGE